MRQAIHQAIGPDIDFLVYVLIIVSITVGVFFMTGIDMGVSQSILYGDGVLVHPQLWGGFLFSTASTALIGLLASRNTLIQFGGLSGFMAWLFACISLVIAGHFYIFLTFGLLHLVFHAHLVLSASLGYLRRSSVPRR